MAIGISVVIETPAASGDENRVVTGLLGIAGTLMTLLDDIGSLFRGLGHRGPAPAVNSNTTPKSEKVAVTSLSAEKQWACVAGVLQSSIESVAGIAMMQKAASLHIDAAAYALDNLLSELAGTMQIPGRTPAQVVHRIEPAAPRLRRSDALAA